MENSEKMALYKFTILDILHIITVYLFAAKRIPPVGRLLVVIVGGIDLTPGENGMALSISIITAGHNSQGWFFTGLKLCATCEKHLIGRNNG